MRPKLLWVALTRSPIPWGRAFISCGHAAPDRRYGSISPGVVSGWICVDVAACVAVSPAERALGRSRSFSTRRSISVRLRRHRQARRYTLRIDAPSREVVLTMPPRGSVREAQEFAQKHGGWIAARLKRLPEAAPFAHGIEVPLRGEPHRIVHRRGERGTVWTETDGSGRPAALRRGRAAACRPPHQRFPQARGATRSRCGEPRATPTSSASRSSASRCATSRAAGAPARPPACCRSPGGSFSRRRSCSTISPRTRSPISSS